MTTRDETGQLRHRDEAGWLPLMTQRPYAEQKCVNVNPPLL